MPGGPFVLWKRWVGIGEVLLLRGGGGDFADGVNAAKMVEEQADVAQLVEQLIRNQQVNGSSPFVGSIEFWLRVGRNSGVFW